MRRTSLGEIAESLNLSTQQTALGDALRDAAAARNASARDLAREIGLTGEELTLSAAGGQVVGTTGGGSAFCSCTHSCCGSAPNQFHSHQQRKSDRPSSIILSRRSAGHLAAPDTPQRYEPSGGFGRNPPQAPIQMH